MKTAIHWFRRDLRITDNTALRACAARAEEVIPVYVVSDWKKEHHWTGPHRQEFLCGSLKSLGANLKEIGAKLIIRQGAAVEELLRLATETGTEAIYFNRDPDPFGRKTQELLRKEAGRLGIEVFDFKDVCIHERDEVLNGSGDPFRVFTPYSKAWEKISRPEVAGKLHSLKTPSGIKSLEIPDLATWGLKKSGEVIEPGEKAARTRMKKFLDFGLAHYGDLRDLPGQDGTSRLSQDLRYGLISAREVFEKCSQKAAELPAKGRSSAQKYLGELIWREFYMAVLWHFPNVLAEEFNPKHRGMPWPGKKEHFARWCEGKTGFPIVDASMRQLNETGFMHNRARMIVAMFLTKDLHLDWRLGESYFMQQLTDGEIASNNGGWQWSAGTGADAAPYFRIQNPWSQTARFDADGEYIKRWVPELRDVAPERFQSAPKGGSIAKGYPLPIVDHAEAREKTLQLFKSHTAGK
jgi:deoxyribodipyrimidine photo-lyase